MKTVVNIKRGKLLEPFFENYIKNKYPDHIFLEESEILEKIELFKTHWLRYEMQFFEALSKIANLNNQRSIIDVFIVSATDRDFSAPVILRSRYEPDEFVCVLMHELIHVVLTDNNIKIGYKDKSKTTRNHIYVFALLTYLLKDVFKKEDWLRRERSKSDTNKNSDYQEAWDIVDSVGYKEIISDIKK